MSRDPFSKEARSAVMRRVKGRDTGPERAVRRILTELKVGYRLHRKDLPGTPDLVLTRARAALFVHGCFWHGHPCKRGARLPTANRLYWEAKITRNRARDQTTRDALEALGWRVEVIWECQLKAPDLRERLAVLAGKTTPPS